MKRDFVLVDLDEGVDLLHLGGGGIEFLLADRSEVKWMTFGRWRLVREIDHIGNRRGRCVPLRRPQRYKPWKVAPRTAGADEEHLRLFEFELTFHPDFRDDDVPAIAKDFVVKPV